MKRILTIIIIFLWTNYCFAEDLKLTDILSQYLKNNKTLKSLKNQSEAKKYLINKAESLKYPSLDLDISYTLLDSEPRTKTALGSMAVGEDKYLKGQLVLSYIIYDFGKRDNIINKAVLDKDITNLYIKKEINDQSLTISKLFYQLLSLEKTKEIFEEELKSLQEHKKRIDGFFEVGLVTRNEVLQIDVEINNTKQKIIKTNNDIQNLKEILRLLTGIEGDYKLIDNIEIDESTITEEIKTDTRPEIEIAKRLLYLKNIQLKETDSDYYPKFYAGTGINYEENRYRVNDYNYFLTLGMKINLYSGSSTTNEKLAITKEIEEQKERLNLAKDIVLTDIRQSINDIKTAENRKEVAKTAINQTEENLKIQQGKYEEHLIPATDLIDATLLLSRAKLNYILAFYEYKSAYLKLLWAKGKLVNLTGGK